MKIDKDGRTPLMLAAKSGKTKTVKLLLDEGADIEATGIEPYWNALLMAANEGHTDTVALLLDKGADVDAKDNDGQTALMLAEIREHEETVKYLKEFAAGRGSKDSPDRKKVAAQKKDKGSKDQRGLSKKQLPKKRK